MDSYRPYDITEKAKQLCAKYPLPKTEKNPYVQPKDLRTPVLAPSARSGQRGRNQDRMKLKVLSRDSFSLNRETVDLRYVEQLADMEQTNALGHILRYTLENLADGKRSFPSIIQALENLLGKKGLEGLFDTSVVPGNLAMPRVEEIRCCLNRYRGWKLPH